MMEELFTSVINNQDIISIILNVDDFQIEKFVSIGMVLGGISIIISILVINIISIFRR